ncbi:MAG: hypothetical protein QGE96_02755 [Candidatus Poseidoniia archaeon]|jgi:hypothetical protein|nr:hypothetical protein [Euryarchaeota archaeon]MDP6236836.1 hypothetical protein [Candidatus Poseidoniia archaeon]MDP7082497.1 hypothetical protein [Candidatus Poseidoniia archaeon]MDP7255878.1 hypothetical protein [Candidatus Poseidoniia archaeon]MDP7474120.1 hypothetical protein [Candidatus Poseidoniia archaeon]|tara:strand:- start:406 stop:816 length:411 start_codon:yes stop_codon:yes gene_type:complete
MASRGKPSLVSIGALIIVSLGLCLLLQTTEIVTTDQAMALWLTTGGLIFDGVTLTHGWQAGASLLKPRFRLEEQLLLWLYGGQMMTVVGLGTGLYAWGMEYKVVGALVLVLFGLVVLFNHSCVSRAGLVQSLRDKI